MTDPGTTTHPREPYAMFADPFPADASRPDPAKLDHEGRSWPEANVLKAGFRTPIPRVPEDVKSVNHQARIYFYSLNPRNDFHAWLVEDSALCTIRLDRVARIERRERDRIALRADLFWDQDRQSEAEQVGVGLARHPAATVRALEKTPQGCEWLMRRWALLARVADLDGAWDEAQTTLAFDLLATPPELRRGVPGQALDEHGRATDEAGGDLAAIARGQVDRLKVVRDAAKEADALDRAMAMADMADATSPELRRLRRYESTLHKRLRWNLFQLQQEPKWAAPHPNLRYLYPEAEPSPEPVSEPPPAGPEPQPVADDPPADPIPDAEPPARTSRQSPTRARALRESRWKKGERQRE